MQCYLNEKCVGNISFTFHNISFDSLLYSLNSLYHVVLICNLGKHGGPVHSTAVVFVGHVRTVPDPERGFSASQPSAAAAEAKSSNLLLQKKTSPVGPCTQILWKGQCDKVTRLLDSSELSINMWAVLTFLILSHNCFQPLKNYFCYYVE